MENWIDVQAVIGHLKTLGDWLVSEVLNVTTLGQLLAVAVAYFVARYSATRLARLIDALMAGKPWSWRTKSVIDPLYMPAIWLALLMLVMLALSGAGLPTYTLRIVVSLLSAWIVIGLAASLVRNREASRIIAFTAWTFAALNIVGLLGPTLDLMDRAAIHVGELRLSVLSVVTGIITFSVLVWLSVVASSMIERRLVRAPALTPALRVLFGKITKISLITLAIIIGLASAGIDLTAFAVFGGAIGVGIGFGLQKVISNLISGVILLLDRSIKPGDVIEVGQSYGWINTMAARYTSVITRDGTEHLIPNEDIITRPVINWTYSHTKVRRHIPVSVAYKTDLRQAMALMREAAAEAERVIDDPAPVVLLREFGDNGVNLELRMWINDPQHGVSNVASEVMMKIWDKFHEAGIEFPYPQRDVHLIPPDETVVADRTPGESA